MDERIEQQEKSGGRDRREELKEKLSITQLSFSVSLLVCYELVANFAFFNIAVYMLFPLFYFDLIVLTIK